jgi:hypothetical protein
VLFAIATGNVNLAINNLATVDSIAKNLKNLKPEQISDAVLNLADLTISIKEDVSIVNSLNDSEFLGLETRNLFLGIFGKTVLRISAMNINANDTLGSGSVIYGALNALGGIQIKKNKETEAELQKVFENMGVKPKTFKQNAKYASTVLARDILFNGFMAGLVFNFLSYLFAFIKDDEDEQERITLLFKNLMSGDITRIRQAIESNIVDGVSNLATPIIGIKVALTGITDISKFISDTLGIFTKANKGFGENGAWQKATITLLNTLAVNKSLAGATNAYNTLFAANSFLNQDTATELNKEAYLKKYDESQVGFFNKMYLSLLFSPNLKYGKNEFKQLLDSKERREAESNVKDRYLLPDLLRDLFLITNKKESKDFDKLNNDGKSLPKALQGITKLTQTIFGKEPKDKVLDEYRKEATAKGLPPEIIGDEKLGKLIVEQFAEGKMTLEQAKEKYQKNVVDEKKDKSISDLVALNNKIYEAEVRGRTSEAEQYRKEADRLIKSDPNGFKAAKDITSSVNLDSDLGKQQLDYSYNDKTNKFSVAPSKTQDTKLSFETKELNKLNDVSGGGGGGSGGGGRRSVRLPSLKGKKGTAAKITKAKVKRIGGTKSSISKSSVSLKVKSSLRSSSKTSSPKSKIKSVSTKGLKLTRLKPIKFPKLKTQKIKSNV